ncbi:MAG: cellulase family glycosylhydrolase [Anaerolineae bacterium]|nr:cellulase family glycosylhydrolase [Anaerolineae bacterium]
MKLPSRLTSLVGLIAVALAALLVIVLVSAAGDAPPPPLPTYSGEPVVLLATPDLPTLTPVPTLTLAEMDAPGLCAALDAAWGNDWERVVAVVDELVGRAGQCGGQDSAHKRYPAYFNLGAWLETQQRTPEAVAAYRLALAAQPGGAEAARALRRLDSFTPPPPVTCEAHQAEAAQTALPAYTVRGEGPFARLTEDRFTIDGAPFPVMGVNYYPSRGPWRRFLTETSLETVARELDLIREAGFNTVRMFAWHEALFDCPQDAENLAPRPDAFAILDGALGLAAERDLRVIFTLNDLPDLVFRPIYDFPEASLAQTEFIVRRYRDEPAILAWDVRNEGDVDYVRGYTSSRKVVAWMRAAIARVRAADANHLVTAGWNEHAALVEDAVDFVSFHHWRSAQNLQDRIAGYRVETRKPLLLEEVGYSTPAGNELRQVDGLRAALSVVRDENLLGWVAWVAFDYPTTATCTPPNCPSPDNAEHHYGLWRTDYTPKPALAMLQAEFME